MPSKSGRVPDLDITPVGEHLGLPPARCHREPQYPFCTAETLPGHGSALPKEADAPRPTPQGQYSRRKSPIIRVQLAVLGGSRICGPLVCGAVHSTACSPLRSPIAPCLFLSVSLSLCLCLSVSVSVSVSVERSFTCKSRFAPPTQRHYHHKPVTAASRYACLSAVLSGVEWDQHLPQAQACSQRLDHLARGNQHAGSDIG